MANSDEVTEVICPDPHCRKRNRVLVAHREAAVCVRCGALLSGASPRMPGLWRLAHFPAEIDSFYFWRSEREVVFRRLAPEAGTERHYELVAVDAESGLQSLAAAFNHRCGSALTGVSGRASFPQGDETMYWPPAMAASPDGNWLAWHGNYPPSQPYSIGSLDGQQLLFWDVEEDPAAGGFPQAQPVWFRDSHRVAFLLNTYDEPSNSYRLTRATIRGVEAGAPVETVEFTGLPDGLIAGVDSEGCVVINVGHSESDERAEFARASLATAQSVAEPFSIQLPRPAMIPYASVSPDGRRLAFVLFGKEPIAGNCELWVFNLDGSGLRNLVTLPTFLRRCDTRITGVDPQWLKHPVWMPGGEWLSFLYGDALWALPVNAPSPAANHPQV